jgi:hypothetical protein
MPDKHCVALHWKRIDAPVVWCMVYGSMKVTFELPPPVVQRLRFHVPSGERSKFVADLISSKLRSQGNALERAAQKANTRRKVNRDMKDWEALNEYED